MLDFRTILRHGCVCKNYNHAEGRSYHEQKTGNSLYRIWYPRRPRPERASSSGGGLPHRSTSGGPYGRGVTCSGWATLCSDAAFGDLPWKRIYSPRWEQIRAGDLVLYNNDYGGHVVVVLDKTDEYIKVTESGLNNHARWGGQYFRWWLEQRSGLTLYTRYPE